MAFVVRSDKQIKVNNQYNDLGPGHYFNEEDKTANFSNKHPPFLTGAAKEVHSKKKEILPGPGSYYHDELKEKIEKQLQKANITENPQTLYRALDYDQFIQNDMDLAKTLSKSERNQVVFMSKDKRFKDFNSNFEIPGPGYYIKNNDKKIKEKYTHQNKNNKLSNTSKYNVNNSNRVVSIPNKDQGYGYEIDEDGKINLNENPEKDLIYKGTKNEAVGPGSYNIIGSENWHKKGTVWSKSKAKKLDYFKENNLNENIKLKRSNSFDLINSEVAIKNKSAIMMAKQNLMNIIRNKKVERKKINERNTQDNFSKIESNLLKDTPGPGYYFDNNIMSAFRPNTVMEYKQSFGSNTQRFFSIPPTKCNVGPGSYFKEDKNKKKFDRSNLVPPITKNYTTASEISTNKNFVTPGPGQYDPDKYFCDTKTTSNPNNYFGSTEKRFTEQISTKEQIKNPGPGSYNTTDNWHRLNLNQNKMLVKPPRKVILEKRSINTTTNNNNNNSNKDVPAVGSYNSDTIYNIDYKIFKNANKFLNVGFNSTVKRKFIKESELDPKIGPGYYYKPLKAQLSQNFPPFKMSERRFNETKVDAKIGPGVYNQTSYFDWNKKSFNVLYL